MVVWCWVGDGRLVGALFFVDWWCFGWVMTIFVWWWWWWFHGQKWWKLVAAENGVWCCIFFSSNGITVLGRRLAFSLCLFIALLIVFWMRYGDFCGGDSPLPMRWRCAYPFRRELEMKTWAFVSVLWSVREIGGETFLKCPCLWNLMKWLRRKCSDGVAAVIDALLFFYYFLYFESSVWIW